MYCRTCTTKKWFVPHEGLLKFSRPACDQEERARLPAVGFHQGEGRHGQVTCTCQETQVERKARGNAGKSRCSRGSPGHRGRRRHPAAGTRLGAKILLD